MRNRGKAQLWALAKSSIALLKSYNQGDSLQVQCQKHGIMKGLGDLKFNELQLDHASTITRGLGIRNIFEFDSMRMTIYYLPQGEVMKLHDHPRMQVISYVLRGKMEAKVYSPLPDRTYDKETTVLEEKSIRFIDGCLTTRNNLHEFIALQPTFFLDILFPDYDVTRQCRFYEEGRQVGETIELKEVANHEVDFYQL